MEDRDIYNVTHNRDVIYIQKTSPKKSPKRTYLTEEEIESGIIVTFPYSNNTLTCFSKTNEILRTRKFRRCGIIPYTIYNDKKYFCMGVDSKFGTLTDFGGSSLEYETFISTMSRKLNEESLSIFNFTPDVLFNNTRSLYDENHIISLLHISADMSNICKAFFTKYENLTLCRNSSIMWIDENIFHDLVKTGKSIRRNDVLYPSIYKIILPSLRNLICILDTI
jgi:hypothetical protein